MTLHTKAQNDLENYEEQNPLLTCKCGREFRKHGYDRHGNKRIYTQCMTCFQEDFALQIARVKDMKREMSQTAKDPDGYGSMKDYEGL